LPTPARLFSLLALTVAGLAFVPAAQAAVAPAVTDTWVAKVGTAGVDLRGTIDTGEAATNARFEYILDSAYEANLASVPPRDPYSGAVETPIGGKALPAGSVPVELKQAVGGLRPGATYHFRVVASNSEGTIFGPSRKFTIRGVEESAVLDGRGWEMVSPVDKNGGEVQGPGGVFGGGVFQASAAPGAVSYSSLSSFGAGQGAPGASQYVSRRGGSGWSTENVTTPSDAGVFDLHPDGVPYQLFSPDLERAIILNPQRCETAPCPRRYQLRQSSTGALTPSVATPDLNLAGVNADASHTVLSTCAALTPDAVEVAGGGGGCDTAATNLYAWSGGGFTLVNLLPGDSEGTPGAALGAQGANSISGDGSRIYFSLGGNLYLRDAGQTVEVDEAAGGGGTFQAASADGGVAFFLKAEHLYRYAVASGLASDLTPAGEVLGVLGTSGDASYLYYLAAGDLFLEHGGLATKVADDADASDYPPSVGTSRIGVAGDLVFLSSAALTEADTGGYSEVYLYRPSTDELTCVSCNPTGARPLGASTIAGAVANGEAATSTQIYKPRVLSAADNRIFFESDDALVLTDTDGRRDVYEWEAGGVGSCANPAGCLGLISSGRADDDSSFLDASADGTDAFFLTGESLVEADPTGADVYDARIGGGFPVSPQPTACVADACQVVPGEPDDPALGTGFFRTEGNPPVTFPKAKKHKKKHHRRAHHKKKRQSKKRHGS
jgi:hypothetical protein